MGLPDLVLALGEGPEEGPPCATEEGGGREVELALELGRVPWREFPFDVENDPDLSFQSFSTFGFDLDLHFVRVDYDS